MDLHYRQWTAIDAVRKQSRAPVPTETLPEMKATQRPEDEIWVAWEVNLAIAELPDDQRVAVDTDAAPPMS